MHFFEIIIDQVWDIASILSFSVGTLDSTIAPLIDEQTRLQISHSLLVLYEEVGDELLKSIAITDDTWVHHFTPETERVRILVSNTKERQVQCFNRLRLLLGYQVDFRTEQSTVNAQYFTDLLRRYCLSARCRN